MEINVTLQDMKTTKQTMFGVVEKTLAVKRVMCNGKMAAYLDTAQEPPKLFGFLPPVPVELRGPIAEKLRAQVPNLNDGGLTGVSMEATKRAWETTQPPDEEDDE